MDLLDDDNNNEAVALESIAVDDEHRRLRSSSIASSTSGTSKKPKRRRSVNVASVYRGSFHHEEDDNESDQDIEGGLPVATERAIDTSFLTTSTAAGDDDADNSPLLPPVKRRNSLQVATLYREKSRKSLAKELSAAASGHRQLPWWNMNSLQVSSSYIRDHIQYGSDDETNHQQDVDHQQQRHQQRRGGGGVQLNIPSATTTIASGRDYQHDNVLVRRQKRTNAVTFGAYMDTHNDEMIPELVRVASHSSSSNENDNSTSSESEEVDPESPGSSKTQKNKKKSSTKRNISHKIYQMMKQLQSSISNGSPIIQMIFTFMSVIFTHVIMNYAYPRVDLQLMTMVLVVLCGSTIPHLITCVACGVYAGSVSSNTLPFPAIFLLAFITSIAWQYISYKKIMMGYSGRLGATAFLSMNITAILTYLIVDTSKFERYYIGNVDDYYTDRSTLDIIMECIITILSTTFLAMTASWFRLHSSIPVNPVLIPSSWSLCCMLIVSCGLSLVHNGSDNDDDSDAIAIQRYNLMIQNGFAVGSYVAMAAESRLPTVVHFGIVGGIASIYIILLNPFFNGFGGKSGFTAMISYVTYLTIQKTILSKTVKTMSKKKKKTENNEQVLILPK